MNGAEAARYTNPPAIKSDTIELSVNIAGRADGVIRLQAEAYQGNENAGHIGYSQIVRVTVDRTAPSISASATPPANANGWNKSAVTVHFSATDEGSGIASVTPDTVIRDEVVRRTVIGTAIDRAGNSASAIATVSIDMTAPAVTNLQPANGSEIPDRRPEVSGEFTDALSGIDCAGFSLTIDGASITTGFVVSPLGFTWVPASDLSSGNHTAAAGITDSAGNHVTASTTFTIRESGPPLPPDPSTIAPPLSTTGFTPMSSATEFLYTGANPIQTGVVDGTIEPARAAVVRGKVLNTDGAALPGVTITILNHPEFGQTLSRADGMFDMAVNGGGLLSVVFSKSGYLEVQRPVEVPWQDYSVTDTVRMLQRDPVVTEISLADPAPIKVARGSIVTDQDGTRQATLMIPQGTTAEIILADGTHQAVSTLHLRATEYTVGPEGEKMMPAPLPPASAYTYAVELSADEAVKKVNGRDVIFNRPVYFYVDNFLGFPAGTAVPTGYYDNDRGIWVPINDGRVISILAIVDGKAQIDVNGTGNAATPQELAAMDVSEEELLKLGQLYHPGNSLWRVGLNHLSTIDCNWPEEAPAGADFPKQPDPKDDTKKDNDCKQTGKSIIEVKNRILREKIDIVSTAYSINYAADRVPGRIASRTVDIQLAGGSYPDILQQITVRIFVAGIMKVLNFDPCANLHYAFTWDGKDAFGREVYGKTPAIIDIWYIYNSKYQTPYVPATSAGQTQSFGAISGFPSSIPARRQVIFWQKKNVMLGNGFPAQDAAGWSINVHHTYDPIGKTIYFGDGGSMNAQNYSNKVRTIAGTGIPGFTSDSPTPATQSQLNRAWDLETGPDGVVYVADKMNHRIRAISSDGIMRTIAGSGGVGDGLGGFAGDGGPAIQARLNCPTGISLDREGDIFIADSGNNRIRRIDSYGSITTIAGTGIIGFGGDGGPALDATFNGITDIAAMNDGSIMVVDGKNYRIRQINANGILRTIAGTGVQGFSGDGGPAIMAELDEPSCIQKGNDGSIYILTAHGARKISTNGIISTIAGTKSMGFCIDHDDNIYSSGFIAGPYYCYYIQNLGINKITSSLDNIPFVHTKTRCGMPWDFAMWDFEGYTPQNVDISQNIYGDGVQHLWLAASRGGALYVACNEGRMPWMSRFERIFVIMSTLPGFSDNDISIPSSDGGQVFRFDSTGRHLATVDSRNGKLVYSFEYDPNGFLSAIHDASGNIVAIERNAAGDLMAVVSPYGQRTLLETGNDGYLSAVTNPAGGKTGMSYQAGGLLTNFTDANGNSSHFTYDSLGVLLKDENAAGGFTMLTKKSGEKSDTIIDSTAEGRVRTYSTEKQPDGSMKSMVSACCGGTTASITNIDGSSRTDYADGTHITTEIGPDPRFGIGSPFVKRRTISTPGGQSNISTSSRTAILRSIGDIFSLQKLIDIDTINYRIYQTVYDDSTRTITSTSPEGRTSVSTIDTLGRVLRIEIPGLEPISFAYDPRGRLSAITEGTGADARARSFAYNSDGYVDYSQNPLSERTGFSYDLAGRITSQTLPDLRQIGFAYDAAGNVTGITPPGRPQHAFSYTPVNLQQQYDPPQLDAGPTPTSYSYDRDKKLTRITRPDGAAINFSYDGLGRIATMTTPDGTATYDYDPMKNHLNTITTADGQSLNFAYNGMLLTRTEWSGVVNDSIAFNYNNDFRITSRTVHGIMTDAYSYDNDGLLTGAGTMTFSRNAQNGLLAGTALGNVADAYQYNQFGEMAGYTAKYAGAAIISIQYQRDKLGRITEKTEATGGTTHTYHYTYNTAGYLTEVRTDGAVTGSYSYDANGNRTSYSGILGSASGTYDAQDRILAYGGATYTYTANGELSSKTDASGTTHYTYDVLGNLRQVTLPDGKIIEYIIDGQNRRIGKKINGAIAKAWIYEDQLRPAAELDGAGNIIARFIYGTKINVPEYVVKSGVTYRIITDHLGSPRMVVAANTGSVVQTIQYDEYGVALADDNPGFVPFGFAGGLYDGEAGLVRFGARDYDVSRGRLTCKDPAEFNSDICIYAYANNDPINFADPRGSVIFQVFVDGGTSRNTKKCKGSARVIKGNSNLIGKIGAFKGTAVSANSAAIIPEQFGGYSKSQISPYIKDISGVCKTTSFVGITDIIGGVSPIKGMNVRDALRQLNPGKFVVELPSAEKDLGSQEIELTVPSDVPCPEGTKEE